MRVGLAERDLARVRPLGRRRGRGRLLLALALGLLLVLACEMGTYDLLTRIPNIHINKALNRGYSRYYKTSTCRDRARDQTSHDQAAISQA